ncbi:MAG: pyridoxal-5-phosphate-dependent protein subunit beta [bacterium]
MIDLSMNEDQLQDAVERAREKDIIIPTLEQQKNPELVPDNIKEELTNIGLWDINPRNLFRITWQNEPVESGGQYGGVNYVELPKELTGVDARIIALVGKWFPTGAHKVGATFGCLVPRLVTGQFNPAYHQAVWPSTGNYCRGGAYDSSLLACDSIAILPEGMSQERFDWLSKVAGETFATPGTESNVKEIFDKCWELREDPEYKDRIIIFNQFDEFGNNLWHYEVTGNAMEKVLDKELREDDTLAGTVLTTGSSGTLGCAEYMKELFPKSRLAAGEALQCPTLLNNGFGAHRIEGIGDKHVPWIHNVRNTDTVVGIDDQDCMDLIRLFNEPAGHDFLREQGVSEQMIDNLELMGISSVANVLSSIKFAKNYELDENDVVLTVWTDSMEMYGSRLKELREEHGEYTERQAAIHYEDCLLGQEKDHVLDLGYQDRQRIHNLKYYTWIEQQGKMTEELNRQWDEYPEYWDNIHDQADDINELIREFNDRVGIV